MRKYNQLASELYSVLESDKYYGEISDYKGLGRGPAVLYRAVRENFSRREVWLEKEGGNEVREKVEAKTFRAW